MISLCVERFFSSMHSLFVMPTRKQYAEQRPACVNEPLELRFCTDFSYYCGPDCELFKQTPRGLFNQPNPIPFRKRVDLKGQLIAGGIIGKDLKVYGKDRDLGTSEEGLEQIQLFFSPSCNWW
jgi:hypothetical protein